jgi:hypothetical protein
MRKRVYVLVIGLAVAGLIVVLNMPVSIRQCIDYQCRNIRLPLYLKALDFVDRHYNYRQLARKIASGAITEEEKVLKIFNWTHGNIKRVPEGFPIIDDHVWHIIVRGYGMDDQSCDVFTTLCNYAGIDAFFRWAYIKGTKERIPLSFAKIDGRWCVFDPYNAVYFRAKSSRLASVKDIISDLSIVKGASNKPYPGYAGYYEDLKPVRVDWTLKGRKQMPVARLIFEVRKFLKIEKEPDQDAFL